MKTRTTFVRDGMTVVLEDGVLDSEIPIGDGVARWFYKNGKVKAEVPKVAGETQGIVRKWHENGQLAEQSTVISRQICGVARSWNRDGSIESEAEYIIPDAIYVKSYDVNGKIRHIFLWIGKPISKSRWVEKVLAAGISRSEIERKIGREHNPGK
jgi:hypothetical protein